LEQVCAYVTGGVMIAACQYGYGQHVANLVASNKIEALRVRPNTTTTANDTLSQIQN
jgi:hypothetical protein